MSYTKQEVMDFIRQEDVKFIRLAFCDVYGVQKNVSIMPSEIERAFSDGISFDGSAIDGFAEGEKSDLILKPDPSTLAVLPWRPTHGRVIRMFCDVVGPNGAAIECDCRSLLQKTIKTAHEKGVDCLFGTEIEFYLFKTGEDGEKTLIPFDNAAYMDIAPDDRGENVRREICLALEEMGIIPESSRHEDGPGQNEIDFRCADPLTAADNAVTFKFAVRTIAAGNGLWASFDPKPLPGKSGSGMHINISLQKNRDAFMAGVMAHISEMSAFLNPTDKSYARLGDRKAPRYISWAHGNRSQLIRIPEETTPGRSRFELRSPDPTVNPYLAIALLIQAGLDGIEKNMALTGPVELDLTAALKEFTDKLDKLPETLEKAKKIAAESEFIRNILPKRLLKAYTE
ncbi:MAG TPA: glutamine synthetase family protein [Oscillospiraceae bacterium]|nr:glutamine synthetase family protein [Oscillospiraceae bacterium]HPF56198.1 glutamine synthetase family protein [Clostridiales bacterium]HPK35985.1 glutamine synthetase family protein [Oscillospiraceae bacterium]HPR76229.1 glutamine synthetase family protein [Oscillospiraceae bacterium]